MITQETNEGQQAVMPPNSRRRGKIHWSDIKQIIIVVLLISLVILTLIPILFMVISSLKNNSQILSSFWSLPSPPQWINYSTAFTKISRFVLNTVLYAVSASFLVMALSSVGGYIFAKKSFPGKEFFFLMMLAMMMIPSVLTLIPAYVLYANMGLTNTPWVILIASAAGGQVFGTFLCRTSMAGISDEMFEASRIDGASEITIFFRIVLPLSLPILATLFIMHSVGVYNDYIWPLLTIRDDSLQVISVALTTVFNKNGMVEMGPQFAAYAISSIPLVLTFAFGMKYYVQGMTQGALKM